MMTPASKRGPYTGMKASKNTSSLLSRLILFIQIQNKAGNMAPTTRQFRDSEGLSRHGGEKTLTLAYKKGWIIMNRSGNSTILAVTEKGKAEVETLYQILSNDPDVR